MLDNNFANEVKKEKPPLKWVKHIMLVFWGLRDINDLMTTIYRFKINDYKLCLNDIGQEVKNGTNNISYIIKLVYKEKFYKLPNYMINNYKDLKKVNEIICSLKKNDFCEIWYCKHNDESVLYGRILYELNDVFPLFSETKVDMVWGNSARMIENFPNINCPFVAIESRNMYDYSIYQAIYKERSPVEINKTVNNVIKKIRTYHKYIFDFCEFLRQCGCSHVSIEFVYKKDGSLRFIDWDSDNDILGIKNFVKLYAT